MQMFPASAWSLVLVCLFVAVSSARPAVDWSTLTPEQMETLPPSDFASLDVATVSKIPPQAIATMTFLQAASIPQQSIRGFNAQQVAFFAANGSRSMCAQMSSVFVASLVYSLSGLSSQCAAIMSDAAIGGIRNYQIQNITLDTFKSIRNFAALSPDALAAATFQQLMAIPKWPLMPYPLILAAFSSPSGADIANSVDPTQMTFDPDNMTQVDNIIRTKGSISSKGLGWDALTNRFASQNPQAWNWIHVATITQVQTDDFWTVKNNVIPTQAWAGLQASQNLQPQLLQSFSIDALHSLMGDTFAFDSKSPASLILAFPATAMPYFNLGVYLRLTQNAMDYFDVPHVCSISPAIAPSLQCAQLTGFNWATLGRCYSALVSAFVDQAKTKNCGTQYNLSPVEGPIYYPSPWVGMDPPSLPPAVPPASSNAPVAPPTEIAPESRPPAPNPPPALAPAQMGVPDFSGGPVSSVPSPETKLAIGLSVGLAFAIVASIVGFLFYRRKRRENERGERQPLLINEAGSPSGELSMINFSLLKGDQFENAILMERLGSGGSGAEVFRCSVGGFTCAVKVMDMALFGDSSSYDEFINEITLLIEASRRSEFVVKYLHHVEVGQQCRLFMEYCPTTLSTQIDIFKRDNQRFKSSQIGKICRPILMALSALHTQDAPILHRDLKAANVFAAFDRFGNVVSIKLGDFGISKLLEHGTQARTVVGTPGYIPPEVLRRSSRDAAPYSTAADIYSFGMILFELLTLKAPYSEFKWDADRCDAILAGQLPQMPALPDEYRAWIALFERCVALDPAARPTANELLQDPLFKA
eukprot:TRINITY_DN13568_c0_g1_i1.p1 TRINITY_DN13568_c0_g1~~TRINITY_DN13568_c0_g1_i1.p1  ORF type:complete len:814 (+),score=119.44 TRINITY_DN13568_c0_g1_i1:77-2518(+)